MSENLTRLLSGIVYILVLIGAIFISEYTFIALILFFGWVCITELQKLIGLKSFLPYILFIAFVVFFGVFKSFGLFYIPLILAGLTLIVDILLLKDLFAVNQPPLFSNQKLIPVVFYLIAAFVFMMLIPYQNFEEVYNPQILLGVFILIWSSDTFAYIFGRSFGKRKLLERISPKKTIEGFAGGVLATLLTGWLIYYFTDTFNAKVWIGLAVITSVFGTFGDLIQSKFKRQAGVKDSGNIMPGHGGLFDRLDSVLFAAPFLYLFLMFFKNVS